jgi:hypothetical protein
LAILRNCTSCHDSEKPDFTLWPIGGSKEVMRTWTDKIAISMDFEHDGANRKMPPAKSPWQPTRAEADLLRDWIRDGAPDATGVPQI